jgi:hypothetical protein
LIVIHIASFRGQECAEVVPSSFPYTTASYPASQLPEKGIVIPGKLAELARPGIHEFKKKNLFFLRPVLLFATSLQENTGKDSLTRER